MEVNEAIDKRRSIRKYKDIEIDDEIIEDIIKCGTYAPSAKNKQPWYFVIIKGNFKNEIASMMEEYALTKESVKDREKIGFNSSVNLSSRVIKEAPVLILVYRKKDDNWVRGDNLSIGAALENMSLRCIELGLGTLWLRDVVYVSETIAKKLKLESMEFSCGLTVGYPNEFPNKRGRKSIKEVTMWIK